MQKRKSIVGQLRTVPTLTAQKTISSAVLLAEMVVIERSAQGQDIRRIAQSIPQTVMISRRSYFTACTRHITLSPFIAIVQIHRQHLHGGIRRLCPQFHALRRLADTVFPPREREEITRHKETPSCPRRSLCRYIPPVFVLHRTSLTKRMGIQCPIIVRIITMQQQ